MASQVEELVLQVDEIEANQPGALPLICAYIPWLFSIMVNISYISASSTGWR